ncbi:MAG: hypothetical protein ABI672_02190 [Vicinamibacteria bacterium]
MISQVNGPHLIVEELGDELIVFDRQVNKAHMLDARAALIWRASGSGVSLDSLTDDAAGDRDHARALNHLAILDLERAGLVVTAGFDAGPVSRRSLLKILGASVTAPLVVSILAPTTAAAATMCNTSSGGDLGGTRLVNGGTCGTTCATPVGTLTCHSSSSGPAAADGCACMSNNNCCSGNCPVNICLP